VSALQSPSVSFFGPAATPFYLFYFVFLLSGRQGIPGNEADRLAKEGAIEVPLNQFAALYFSVGSNCNRGTGPGGLPVLDADNPKC
jgi:hypothetical protein